MGQRGIADQPGLAANAVSPGGKTAHAGRSRVKIAIVTVVVATGAIEKLAADDRRLAWRGIELAVLAWCVIDSGLSIVTGFALNAVSNAVFVSAFLVPLVRGRAIILCVRRQRGNAAKPRRGVGRVRRDARVAAQARSPRVAIWPRTPTHPWPYCRRSSA